MSLFMGTVIFEENCFCKLTLRTCVADRVYPGWLFDGPLWIRCGLQGMAADCRQEFEIELPEATIDDRLVSLLRSHFRNPATESHFSNAAAMSAEGAGADWRQIHHVGLSRLQRQSQEGIEKFLRA